MLHAGFYYSANSLKAQLTRDGNTQLAAYCTERGLPLSRCGKLVVATSAEDLEGLEELQRRGVANGVRLEALSAAEIRRIEPRARTHEWALFSPSTATVAPAAVVASLVADALRAGIVICTGVAYRKRGRRGGGVLTSDGPLAAGYVVNAAGLYADRVARDFGFSERYRILPFRGRYLVSEPGALPMRTHVYPVPKLANPFLGVHITRRLDGSVKIGPTATAALWREHYGGFGGFALSECLAIAGRELALLARDRTFRRLAAEELLSGTRQGILRRAAALVDGVRPDAFRQWGRPGIRAQLYDLREHRLEMDFRYEGDDRSFHVLNAVSPAFTCALPLATYLGQRIDERLSGPARIEEGSLSAAWAAT